MMRQPQDKKHSVDYWRKLKYKEQRKMETTYFRFIDMDLKVTRPALISHRDKDIGTRAYERLQEDPSEDEWTIEVDKIIADHNITFAKVSSAEMEKFIKQSQSIIARL